MADPPRPAEREPALRFLDWPHDRLSRLVEGVASGTDALLSGNREYDAPTGSYLVLGYARSAFRPDDGEDAGRPLTRAKVSLPRTEDRLQLLVDRGLETLTRSDAQREAERASGQNTADNSPFASLRLMLVDLFEGRVHTDVGAKLRTPFDPFARVRADRSVPWGEWTFLASQTLLYSRNDRFRSTIQGNLQRPLGDRLTLNLLADATWRDARGALELSQTATVLWALDDATLAGAEAGVLGLAGDDGAVTAYTAALRWRRKLYRDWLVVEVRPQVVYARDRGFRPLPSLTVQAEAYFGRGYLP